MSRNLRLRRGLEPTSAELQTGAGCELVAQRARYAFQQGDYPTAFYLLWEAIASAAVLIIEPAERGRITDPALRQKCLKRLREWNYLRETEAQTLRAFHAIRDHFVDGAPLANRRAQQAISDAAELHRLYHEVYESFQQLLVEVPE